jgi:hypothetical protein
VLAAYPAVQFGCTPDGQPLPYLAIAKSRFTTTVSTTDATIENTIIVMHPLLPPTGRIICTSESRIVGPVLEPKRTFAPPATLQTSLDPYLT